MFIGAQSRLYATWWSMFFSSMESYLVREREKVNIYKSS